MIIRKPEQAVDQTVSGAVEDQGQVAEVAEDVRPDGEGFLAVVDALQLPPDDQRLVQTETRLERREFVKSQTSLLKS